MTRFVTANVDDRIADIVLANPPYNCLTRDIMNSLTDYFVEWGKQAPTVRPRVVILRSGVPSILSHGIDPEYFIGLSLAERGDVFRTLGRMIETIYLSGIPLVVDVNGPALAGGAVLALLGDYVVTDKDHGRICFSETKVGLPLPRLIQDMIASKVPARMCMDIGLLAKNIGASAAVKCGLASASYGSIDEREVMVNDFIGRIKRLSPEVVRYTLTDSRTWIKESMAQFELGFQEFSRFVTDDYLGRGLKALVDGKKIDW